MIATVYEISVALGIPMADLIQQTVQEYEAHHQTTLHPNKSIPKPTH